MEAIKENTPTADALRVVRTLLSQLMIQKWWRIPRDYDEALTSNNLCKGLSLSFDDLYTILRSIDLLYLHMGGEQLQQQSSSNSNLLPSSSIGVNEAMLYRLPRLFPSLNIRLQKGIPIGSRQVVYYILRGTPTTTTLVEQPPTTSTSLFWSEYYWFVLPPKADNETTASPKRLAVSNKAVSNMEVFKCCKAPLQDDIEATIKCSSQQGGRRPSSSKNTNRVVLDIETSRRICKDPLPGYEGATVSRASPSRLDIFNKAGRLCTLSKPKLPVLGDIRCTRLKRNFPTPDDERGAAVKRVSPNRLTTTTTSSNQTVPVMATSQRKALFLVQDEEATTVKRANTKQQQQQQFGPWTASGLGADKKNTDKDCCCTENDSLLLRPLEISTNLMSQIWSIPSAPLVASSTYSSSKEWWSVEEDHDENAVIAVGESAAQRTTPSTTSNNRKGQPKANIDEDSIDYIAEGFACLDPKLEKAMDLDFSLPIPRPGKRPRRLGNE
jgi:hypothetical protein